MLLENLKPFVEKYNEINQMLSSPEITQDIKKMTKLSREARSLEPIAEKAKEYENIIKLNIILYFDILFGWINITDT